MSTPLRTSSPTDGPTSSPTGPPPVPGAPGRSLLVRDALWDGYHFAILAGPLVGVDVEHGRRRLRDMAGQLDPLLGVRADGLRTVPRGAAAVAELAERIVVSDPALDGSTDHVARVLAEPLAGLPFRLSVGREHVAVHVDHVVGDGTAMYELAPWLVGLVTSAEPRPVPSTATSPSPHLTALRNTFDRRSLPPALARTAAQVLAERRAQSSPAPAAWDRRPAVESVLDPRGAAEAVKEFRQTRAKGLSSGFVLMAAVWFALVEHSAVSPDLRPGIGVDLRRHLPRRTPVFGNFSACVRLPEGTPCYPLDLRDALEAEVSSGVPLLAAAGQHGLAGVRSVLRAPWRSPAAAPLRRLRAGGSAAAGADDRGHHGASLVLNHMGRPQGWERLPWQPGAQRVLVNAPSVDSSRAVTVNIVEMSDGPRITASFFDTVVSRAAVRGALEDVSHRLGDVLGEMHRRR